MRYYDEAIMGCTKLTGPCPNEDSVILLLKSLTPSKQITTNVFCARLVTRGKSKRVAVNTTLTWTATLNLLIKLTYELVKTFMNTASIVNNNMRNI